MKIFEIITLNKQDEHILTVDRAWLVEFYAFKTVRDRLARERLNKNT